MSLILNVVLFGAAFSVGVGAIPAWIYLAGTPIGNNMLGKGMFILGQLAHDGTHIRYEGTGDVKLRPFDSDRGAVYDPDNDEWRDVDGEITTYRFGWNDVALGADAELSAPQSTRVNPDDVAAVADGGATLLDETRNGTPMFTDVDPTQPAIHHPRYLQMQGRNGNRMISRAKENALEEFGGASNTSEMMLMMLLIGGFIAMFGITFAMLLVM